MSTVTAVIPNYNYARYLEKRLDTVLCQTYPDIEVLYLDDASKDDSATVFSKYASHDRVRAIVNAVNSGGAYPQWNRGVREAHGEYVWIADADDYADPQLVARLVQKLDSDDGIALAYCQSTNISGDGDLLSTYQFHTDPLDKERWKTDYVNDGRDELARYMSDRNTIPTASALVFRRSAYAEAGYADESLPMNADWLLWARILLRHRVAFVAEPLNYHRHHSGTMRASSNKVRAADEVYKVQEFIRSNVMVPQGACEWLFAMQGEQLAAALYTGGTPGRRKVLTVILRGRKVDRRLVGRVVRQYARILKHSRGRHELLESG